MVADGTLTGVLDWEFAGWSDPLEDIGWFCARCWRFGANAREAGGIGSREHLYEGDEEEAGSALNWSLVPYWEVLAIIRWGVIALLQGERYNSDAGRSIELALTGRKAAEMEFDILQQIAELERIVPMLNRPAEGIDRNCSDRLSRRHPACIEGTKVSWPMIASAWP